MRNRDAFNPHEERKDGHSLEVADVSNDIVTDNSLLNSYRNEKGELMRPATNKNKHRLTVVSRQSKNNFDQLTQ